MTDNDKAREATNTDSCQCYEGHNPECPMHEENLLRVIESQRKELEELRELCGELEKAISDYLAGDFQHPRSYRPNNCPHGRRYWEDCDQCTEEHFQKALAKAKERMK